MGIPSDRLDASYLTRREDQAVEALTRELRERAGRATTATPSAVAPPATDATPSTPAPSADGDPTAAAVAARAAAGGAPFRIDDPGLGERVGAALNDVAARAARLSTEGGEAILRGAGRIIAATPPALLVRALEGERPGFVQVLTAQLQGALDIAEGVGKGLGVLNPVLNAPALETAAQGSGLSEEAAREVGAFAQLLTPFVVTKVPALAEALAAPTLRATLAREALGVPRPGIEPPQAPTAAGAAPSTVRPAERGAVGGRAAGEVDDALRGTPETAGPPPGPVSAERAAVDALAEAPVPTSAREAGEAPSATVSAALGRIRELSQTFETLVERQRRGTRPREAARAEGQTLGLTLDDVKALAPGTAMNDAQAARVVELLGDLATQTQAAARRALASGDDVDAAEALRLFALLGEANPARAGVVAEAGRTLGILNEPISGVNQQLDAFATLLAEGGGMTPRVLLERIAALETPAQLAKLAQAVSQPGVRDMLFEAWVNLGLLSNPVTQSANLLGGLAATLRAIPEQAVAARIPGATIVPGEASAMTAALLHSLTDAFAIVGRHLAAGEGLRAGLQAIPEGDPFRRAAQAFRTGTPQFGAAKLERRRAITGANVLGEAAPEDDVGAALARGIDLLGEAVRSPGRFLLTGDEFVKAVNYRMWAAAEAVRQVRREGLAREATAERLARLMETPLPAAKARAERFALYQTLQQDFGEFGQGVLALRRAPILGDLVRFFVLPFAQAPGNVLKQIGERSPLPLVKLLTADTRAALLRPGPDRDLALARVALGTASGLAIGGLVAAGLVTGDGPTAPALRRAWLETGWQPNSVRIGDTYVGLNRLDPVGGQIAATANLVELALAGELDQEDAVQVGLAYGLAFGDALLSKNYLLGVSSWIDAVKSQDPARLKAATRTLGSVVPAGVAAIARQRDPVLRDFDDYVGLLRSRTPGLSETQPARLTLFGEPILIREALGPDWLSPLPVSTRKADPVRDELVRLELPVAMPDRFIQGVRLSAQQYHDFVRLAAGIGLTGRSQTLHEALTHLLATEGYQRQSEGPDGGKALLIRERIDAYRQAARAQLVAEDRDLRARALDRARDRRGRLRPVGAP